MTTVTKLLTAAVLTAGPDATATAHPVPSPLAQGQRFAPGEPTPGRPFPPHHGPHRPPADYDYAVYVRSPWGGWRYHGTYETRWQAERAEAWLEARGHRAKVVPFRDGPAWSHGGR